MTEATQSILLRNSASGVELTPESRGMMKKSRLGSLSKGDAKAGASVSRATGKVVPVTAGKESTEWDPSAWKKQKKPRSLLIDESKLLHDYNKKSVNCTLCRKSITSSQLRQHMEAVHEISVSYDCDICGVTGLKSKVALRQHVLQLHRLYCCFCRKKFPSKKLLFAHRKKHNDEQPFDCRHCGKSFSSKSIRSQHTFVQHPKTAFCCAPCKAFFPSRRSKSVHDSVVHRKPRLRCNLCRREFLSKLFYTLHSKAGDCRPPAKDCPFCKRKFDNPVIFKFHRDRCRFKNSYSKKATASITASVIPTTFTPTIFPDPLSGVDESAAAVANLCSSDLFRGDNDDESDSLLSGLGEFSNYSTLELQCQTQTESNFLVPRSPAQFNQLAHDLVNGEGETSELVIPNWSRPGVVDLSHPDHQYCHAGQLVTANTFHVPQIDVPPKSADLAIDAAIPDRAFSYGAIVDNSSDNQSLEIGEILGEIFGQSPDRSSCH